MDFLNIVKKNENSESKPLALKIIPKPGFCVKLKTLSNEKIFVNICSDPKPRDTTEEELTRILEDFDNAPLFKIPMSVGEPHFEFDKTGNKCTAYDVILNDSFMDKVRNSDLFQAFLMTVTIEGLEQKYDLKLERNWIVLKNKTHHGQLQEQLVRAESKPMILEIGEDNKILPPSKIDSSVSSEHSNKPEIGFLYVPSNENPEFIVATLKLPKVRTSRFLELDVAEDGIRLACPMSNAYSLETELVYKIDPEHVCAEFNRDNRVRFN